jgi:hypothetical protein
LGCLLLPWSLATSSGVAMAIFDPFFATTNA